MASTLQPLTAQEVAELAGSQPFLPGELPSTQLYVTNTNKLALRVARRGTTRGFKYGDEAGTPVSGNDTALLTTVLAAVKDRLKTPPNTIDPQTLEACTEQTLAFMLPKTGADSRVWDELLLDPMSVPDSDLRLIIALRRSTASTPGPPPNTTIYYMRTFTFTVKEFTRVVRQSLEQGDVIPKAKNWLDLMDMRADSSTVYLRYMGMSETVSGYRRHMDDLKSTNGSRARILETTSLLYPHIVSSAIVHEFAEGDLGHPSFRFDQSLINLRERAIIALMDHQTLFNMEKGGDHPDCRPSQEDAQAYASLQTNTARLLAHQLEPASTVVTNNIMKYADAAQEYANTHPFSTGTAQYPFGEDNRNAIYVQAIPRGLRWVFRCPFVTIGHDPTLKSYRAATPFFETDGFTRKIVVETINQLASVEASNLELDQLLAERMHETHLLPFVDLYQWPKKDKADLPVALKLLRQYLQSANPIVVVTWGFETSASALGQFNHSYGVINGTLMNHVGIPELRYFGETDKESNTEHFVVVIPSYHPNAVSYSNVNIATFLELFGRTMAVAWLAIDYAVRNFHLSMDKEASCRELIEFVKAKTGPATAFGKDFAKVKASFLKQWADRSKASKARLRKEHATTMKAKPQLKAGGAPRLQIQRISKAKDAERSWGKRVERTKYERKIYEEDVDDTAIEADYNRWLTAREEMHMLLSCEWSTDHPNTQNRKEQVQRIFHAGIEPLYRGRTTDVEFTNWATNIEFGRLFYMEATDYKDHAIDLPNLLSIFLEGEEQEIQFDPEDETWLEEQEYLVKKSSDRLKDWLNQKVLKSDLQLEQTTLFGDINFNKLLQYKNPELQTYLSEKIKENALAELKTFPDKDQTIHGSEVTIYPWKVKDPSATLAITWADNEGDMQQLTGHGRFNKELCLPVGVMPTYPGDVRRIFFLPEGIDIRDEKGFSLGRDTPPTIPLRDVILQLEDPIKSKFLELWERETGLTVGEVLHAPPTRVRQTQRSATGGVYPASAFNSTSRRGNEDMRVGARGFQITENTERARIEAFLPLQPGDAHWLFYKFLQENYPAAGVVDTSNPTAIPSADSMWTRLSNFLDQPKYSQHPKLGEMKSVCGYGLETRNTAGANTAIKIAIQMIRPPGTWDRRRVFIDGKQKWKVSYEVGDTVPANVVPPGIEPDPEYDQVLDELDEDDETQVGDDGELITDKDDVQVPRTAEPEEMLPPAAPSARASGKRQRQAEDDDDGNEHAGPSTRSQKAMGKRPRIAKAAPSTRSRGAPPRSSSVVDTIEHDDDDDDDDDIKEEEDDEEEEEDVVRPGRSQKK